MFMQDQTAFIDARTLDQAGISRVQRPATGLFAGTRVETAEGWMDVAGLRPGMELYTQDGGLRRLAGLTSTPAAGEDAVVLPEGAFGNDTATALPGGQMILLGTGAAIDWLGTPVALVPGARLLGLRGVRRRPAPDAPRFTLLFDEEEVIFAASGLCVHCPSVHGDGAASAGSAHFLVLERSELREVLGA